MRSTRSRIVTGGEQENGGVADEIRIAGLAASCPYAGMRYPTPALVTISGWLPGGSSLARSRLM